MEDRLNREKLTVLKESMTLSDMKEYFQFKDGKTFGEWEKKGLKVVKLTEKSKLYRACDIREFLNNL